MFDTPHIKVQFIEPLIEDELSNKIIGACIEVMIVKKNLKLFTFK